MKHLPACLALLTLAACEPPARQENAAPSTPLPTPAVAPAPGAQARPAGPTPAPNWMWQKRTSELDKKVPKPGLGGSSLDMRPTKK